MKSLLTCLVLATSVVACNTTIIEEIVPASSSTLDGGQSNLGCLYVDGNKSFAWHGLFWSVPSEKTDGGVPIANWPLGNRMMWQAWAMGDPWGLGYLVSAGYGGIHPLLWNGTSGNMDFVDASGMLQRPSYGADYGPPPGVFSHVAVALEPDAYGNTWLDSYANGILDGKTLVPAGWTRVASNTGGPLYAYVGGSDHSNFKGWICQLEAWDDQPMGWGGFPFGPRKVFSDWSESAGPNPLTPSQFLVSYLSPVDTTTWDDLSDGYDGHGAYPKRTHPGFGFKVGVVGPATGSAEPIPHSVAFTAPAPFAYYYQEAPVDRGLKPPAPPAGAVIYDSFSRPDQTYAHINAPQLGCVEYPVGGPCWESYVSAPYAAPLTAQIFAGSVRPAHAFQTFHVVPTGSDDGKVMVDRLTSQYNDGVIGAVARWGGTAGAPTYTGYLAFYAYVAGPHGTSSVVLQSLDGAGKITTISTVPWPHGAGALSIDARGSNIDVYIGATKVIAVVDSRHPTGERKGFFFPAIPAGQMSTNETALAVGVWP